MLIDVAAFKGVTRLESGYEIAPADLRGALERQSVEVRSGDVVIVHTGFGSLWLADNAQFSAGSPGIGIEAARYLVEREVVLVGSDTWSTEVVPNPNPDLQFPVHQLLIPRNGSISSRISRRKTWRGIACTSSRSSSPAQAKRRNGIAGEPDRDSLGVRWVRWEAGGRVEIDAVELRPTVTLGAHEGG